MGERRCEVMKLFRRNEGFTLVELMVVVLIIGILVAIAVPIFNAAKANAQNKSCMANQRTIDGAIQTYFADNEDLTAVADIGDLTPDYIKVLPTDPGYGDAYALNAAGDAVDGCPSGNHDAYAD
jgi:prepilin-type N-terminal cleavage/methylation domain-containing protein